MSFGSGKDTEKPGIINLNKIMKPILLLAFLLLISNKETGSRMPIKEYFSVAMVAKMKQGWDTAKLVNGLFLSWLQKRSNCYAIKSDTVESVINMGEEGWEITARTGKNLTYYGNLQLVKVKPGQVLKEGRFLGHLRRDYFEKHRYLSEIMISDSLDRISLQY